MTMPLTTDFLTEIIIPLRQYALEILTGRSDVLALGCDEHVEPYG